MPDRTYRATIEVTLSTTMDEPPLIVLSSILLGALADSDIPVMTCYVEDVTDA